ncbi:MAG: hypothetical protein K2H40_06500 [Lachnospiraceae bacterium]|nr:hypothetical protein [Lachnospiraceae bacterium]
MKSRGIAAGLCICLAVCLAGCGGRTSDFGVDRSQEEARAEVRRHIEQTEEGPEEQRNGKRSEEERDGERSEKGQSGERSAEEQVEKKSEAARAAAEEAHRRRDSSARQQEDDFSPGRSGNDDSSSGRRKSDGSFQVDCISFMLPDGWEKDEYMSDDYDTVFAPDGDVDSAMDCLIVSQVSESFGMIEMFLENMDEMASILEEEIAEEEEEYRVTIDDIGMTFLGHTLKMEAFVRDEEGAGVIVLYFAEDDDNLYSLYAYTMFDEEEDVDKDAGLSVQMEEALRMFFETGQVENRKL